MSVVIRRTLVLAAVLLFLCAMASPALRAQSSYTAQLTGVVKDASGGEAAEPHGVYLAASRARGGGLGRGERLKEGE
jgi:hypothetical protein